MPVAYNSQQQYKFRCAERKYWENYYDGMGLSHNKKLTMVYKRISNNGYKKDTIDEIKKWMR